MSESVDATTVARTTPQRATDHNGDEPFPIGLELVVHDREVIRALLDYVEGDHRNRFALDALKIGVLALRHVGGQATADLIQREVRGMQQTLEQHNQAVHSQLASTLKDYFDPSNGRFSQRVQGLVAKDGELSQLLRSYIDGENSLFAQTLIAHVGRDSPLMKHLDPEQAKGLLSTLRQTVESQLSTHGSQMLKEFSLDNKEGALSRFIGELTDKHGDLTKTVGDKIDVVVKEFSLDKPDSALSRLVQNVDRAQRTITNEFSLDSDTSCLSRLKRELFTVLEAHVKANADFQDEVKGALRELKARREEIARSPHHGAIFEDAVCELLVREAQNLGDIATPTGNNKGLKNKIGDCVIELGLDCAAPGAKIVVEAKEVEKYTLQNAILEVEEARKNRDADLGIFVFSRRTAPAALNPFQRRGNDFFVIWDAESPSTDVILKAAYDAARALCFRSLRQSAASQVDFEVIDKAILEIESRARNLDDVSKAAEAIKSHSNKILDRARIDREAFEKQVALLREKSADLKLHFSSQE